MFRRYAIAAAAVGALVMSACGSSSKPSGGASAKSTAAPAKAGAASTAAPAKAGAASTAAPAKAASGSPIVLGGVGSNSGVDQFPEPMKAAKAVFDEVNKAGGVNGHPIQYLVEDDADTPEGATAAAKRLVEDKKVLAMVGGGSIVDCTTNAKYYGEQKIYSLAGANACADAPNITQLNTGPFLGTLMTFSYMVDKLQADPLCFSGLNVGLTPLFKDTFVPLWEKTTGHKLKEIITSEPNEDLTAAVVKAKNDGCKGVLLAYTEPNYIAYAKIAAAQGLLDGKIKYGMLTSGYSLNVLDKLGKDGEGWVSNSEFLPYTDDADTTPDLVTYKKLMKDAGLPLSSFAQGGYLSAQIMVEALKSVTGDYTRESVNAALEKVTFKSGLLGEPFKWQPTTGGKQANVASKIVQIKSGKFVGISDWVFWPPR